MTTLPTLNFVSAVATLHLVARLVAVLALIQGAEFLLLKNKIKPFVQNEYFSWLNLLRIAIAGLIIWHPHLYGLVILLLMHALTMMLFKGNFNGGSDALNLRILTFTTLGFLSDNFIEAGLWCITLQVCWTYFSAGWGKLKQPKWRSGEALPIFLNSTIYQDNKFAKILSANFRMSKLLCRVIIAFELSFVLAVIHPYLTIGFIILGGFFHLVNSYFLGLNRFFFAWVAAYPTIYYCSHLLYGPRI